MAGRETLFLFSLSFLFVRLVQRSPDILPAEYIIIPKRQLCCLPFSREELLKFIFQGIFYETSTFSFRMFLGDSQVVCLSECVLNH